MSENPAKWRFAVDTGGTFTDVIGLDPEGRFHTLKLLSRSPQYEEASIEGIRRMLGIPSDSTLSEDRIESIRFGTTVATNALLERKGSPVALVVTAGFRDLIEIGHQSRPDIFALDIKKPQVLYSHVVESMERINADGKTITPLDEIALRTQAEGLASLGITTAAVVFLHSWKNPAHEIRAGEILKKKGITSVFLSHRTMNLIKAVGRGQTCLLDAYLASALGQYIERIRASTGNIAISFMKSSGALGTPEDFLPHDALLSGPAGGVVSVAGIARMMGYKGAVGFDMGGTSTDVSRFEGAYEYRHECSVAGIEFQGEMLNIVTIASGGGSVLTFDGDRLRVGPESAGALPGPACYGFGGPLAVTDANLITGRIVTERFPKTFGPGRNAPLDRGSPEKLFGELAREVDSSGSTSPGELALGFIRVVNEQMAMAIKEISVSRGFDVRKYALVCFGGAGGQHACGVASALDMERVVFHPLGSLLSAYGIGLTNPSRRGERTVLMDYDETSHRALIPEFDMLIRDCSMAGNEQVSRFIDLRPKGTDTYLTVEFDTHENTFRSFQRNYERQFGFFPEGADIEAVNLRAEVTRTGSFFPPFIRPGSEAHTGELIPIDIQPVMFEGGTFETPIYEWKALGPGTTFRGPALVVDDNSTLLIEPGFEAKVHSNGSIIASRAGSCAVSDEVTEEADPVLLEVFNNTFRGIAAEMGYTLQNTAYSVNIKERLDFSCALFDPEGGLVANAPHIPVHLGSMGDTVRAILDKCRDELAPGDVYITNDPYAGGSHLPDITAVHPIFSEEGELRFLTAARGHHADIGGSWPGSMPHEASDLVDEGVVIRAFTLVKNGRFREQELLELLSSHPHPARHPEERLADLKAQVAACMKGKAELVRTITRYGWETVRIYMGHVQKNAERSVQRALLGFLNNEPQVERSFTDRLDDGTPITVRITITQGENPPGTVRATIDFTGTGAEHRNDNLNAPLAVTRSATLYVLRTLIGDEIPLNSGCLAPVDIIVPEGTVLNPTASLAVASGNVETSQRVVDVLLGAFGVAAASQGTMNNFLFEVEGGSPYYETIAGGSGATAKAPGASGVQIHMTNTRMTDPEVLEVRQPGLMLNRFMLRKGSGGVGKHPGGDGVVREIRFLRPAQVSIISERRKTSPYGIENGQPGKRGRNVLKHTDGTEEQLGHRVSLKLAPGESIIIETPGGGGWGEAE